MRPLLILRPEPSASLTASKARALGLSPVVAPLFTIEPLDWTAPGRQEQDALLFTSANAVRFAGEQLAALRSLPVHAVGAATATAAQTAGFKVVNVGEEGIDALLATVDPDLRLLHLCGEDRIEPADPSRIARAIPVYRSNIDAAWAPRSLETAVALVHSPRSARIFARNVDDLRADRGGIAIAAISAAAAAAAGEGWQVVEIASTPGDDPLLALAARLCDTGDGE